MRHRPLILSTVLIVAGLVLAAGTLTASASPGSQPGPPEGVPPVDGGPPDGVPPTDGGPPEGVNPLNPPSDPGERGQLVSEAAKEKIEVTNPDGETVSRSLVGFCRSMASWVVEARDGGGDCDDLAELFTELGPGSTAPTSDGPSGAPGDRGRHLGHERALEAAEAGLDMARGLFIGVFALLA